MEDNKILEEQDSKPQRIKKKVIQPLFIALLFTPLITLVKAADLYIDISRSKYKIYKKNSYNGSTVYDLEK